MTYLPGGVDRPYVDNITQLLIAYRDAEVAGKDWKQAFGTAMHTGLGFAVLTVASTAEAVARALLSIGTFLFSLTREDEKKREWQVTARHLASSAMLAFVVGIINSISLITNPVIDRLQDVRETFQPPKGA